MEADKHGVAFSVGVICVSVLIFLGCAMRNYWSATNESSWVIVLFSIPLLTQGTGWLALYFADRQNSTVATFCNFYAFTMLVSAASYCILWIAYLSDFRGNLYSGLALAFVLLLVSLVLVVTFAIMRATLGKQHHPEKGFRGDVSAWMERLKVGLVLMPFWALLHFFAIFLSVAFVFGFALAFHDRNSAYSDMRPPLYKAILPFHEEHPPGTNSSIMLDLCFHFAEGKAEVEMMPPTDISKVKQLGPDDALVIERRRNNYEFMSSLVDRVIATPRSTLVRITLIGRADEKPTRMASYLSNYELSQARSQAVRYEVLRALIQKNYENWRNVEWLILPLSNEQSLKLAGNQQTTCNPGNRDNRLVQASVESVFNDAASFRLQRDQTSEFERLDLMGYMYFAIYTITTTGYGDVIPTTAYAKFLTSLANVFAIFFLVGFINTLISLKASRNGGEGI